jgi:predicted ferric reductase
MADARVVLPAGALVAGLPLVLALTDVHLTGAPAALVVSTATGALAVSALTVQPLLAARLRRLRLHRALGAVALALVLVHVGALFVVSPGDALFAMSPDGPTRARMALMATVALVLVVALGVLRRRLPFGPVTWRILHAYLATLVILLGFGHALITQGALDGAGTVVLVAFGAGALAGVALAEAARRRT